MVISGVSFNEGVCKNMGKDQFVKAHEDSFFLDRSMKDRRTILADAYNIMNKKQEPL